MSITAENKRILESRRRKEIMRSAKKLFYTNGYKNTSMDHIAEDAGISKGLIYHYFKNKETLLLSFSDDAKIYLEELSKSDDPLAALRVFGTDFLVNDAGKYADAPPIQILLTTFAEHRPAISKHDEQNPILQDIGREYLSIFFQKGIASGVFRDGDPKAYGDIYWSYLLGKLLPIKKGNETQSPEIYVEEALSLFRR